jgi:hypothetical protein
MLCGFTARAAVAKVATPLAFTLGVPSVEAPSLNVTVPAFTVPPIKEVTVAVKVTDCPKTDGLADDVTLVDVVT